MAQSWCSWLISPTEACRGRRTSALLLQHCDGAVVWWGAWAKILPRKKAVFGPYRNIAGNVLVLKVEVPPHLYTPVYMYTDVPASCTELSLPKCWRLQRYCCRCGEILCPLAARIAWMWVWYTPGTRVVGVFLRGGGGLVHHLYLPQLNRWVCTFHSSTGG